MPSIFKIRDKITGEYIKFVPYGSMDLNVGLEKDKGRIFKRKSDASVHITNEQNFYKRWPNRFEIVELEIKEEAINTIDVDTFVKAIDNRKKKRDEEIQQRRIKQKQEEIIRLEHQLKSLKGSNL